MKLITKEILKKLTKNFEAESSTDLPLKLFNASGAQTWLINSIEPDGDTMWGLADLGFGFVEFGAISLKELTDIRKLGFKFMLERDKSWKNGKMSDYQSATTLIGA